jgi:uncharacterized GH25 family protein
LNSNPDPDARMNTSHALKALALTGGILLAALPAQAHRGWLLPSATVLSGNEPWVTVDAAISNDVFYFEHNAMRLDGLQVLAPDGAPAAPENPNTGRYRSSFDLKLAQKGTYKLALVNDFLFASYKLGGEAKRLRGSADALAKDLPPQAQELQVTQQQNRVETFVTSGKPSDGVLKPTGRGLELVPVTHPNDLFVGDAAKFRFVLDGQPAAGVQVTVIAGGIRYRDKLEELQLSTDAQGEVSIRWPAPGMYWLNATLPGAARGAAGGTLAQPLRRASYTATLEVLPQ